MKPDKLYTELRLVAEKLKIKVLEQNFRNVGLHVTSGYCKVKNEDQCLIDKHIKLRKKIEVLSECLARFSYDTIYVLPAVRAHLDLYKPEKEDALPRRSDING